MSSKKQQDNSTLPVSLTLEEIPLSELKPHPRNYQVHPDDEVEHLVASIRENGIYKNIVSAREKTILTGHCVAIAAGRAGYTSVPVYRSSLDPFDPRALKLLAGDNEIGHLAMKDDRALTELLRDLKEDEEVGLLGTGYDEETLQQRLDAMGEEYPGQEDGAGEEDVPPDVEEEQTRVKSGDIWQLGRHKIACFDSTHVEQVKRLFYDAIPHVVWSDPPYGVNAVKDNMVGADFGIAKKGKYTPVIGDETTATAIAAYRLCAEFFPLAIQIWWGANNYTNALPPSNCWLIWDKRVDSGIENTFADCELAWTNMTSPSRMHHQLWNGMIREGEHEKRVHPTQKPLNLALWAFEKYGKENDVIYDPFLGSGISVMAAERLGRTVYGCELSPAYIDVIIRRWERESGQEAQLVERQDIPTSRNASEATILGQEA